MEQLRKLGELKTAGVLTKAEFEEKKSDLLERCGAPVGAVATRRRQLGPQCRDQCLNSQLEQRPAIEWRIAR